MTSTRFHLAGCAFFRLGGRTSSLIPRGSTLAMVLGWSPLPSAHTSHQPSDCRRTALHADHRTLVLLLPMCFFDHASGVFTRDPSAPDSGYPLGFSNTTSSTASFSLLYWSSLVVIFSGQFASSSRDAVFCCFA
ncbi:hypothetical protein BDR05DRAFT_968983 [Suillus weaverae]|nr:hypothetical protein BDR05DRAFT_968983 [Suillus weaverae]